MRPAFMRIIGLCLVISGLMFVLGATMGAIPLAFGGPLNNAEQVDFFLMVCIGGIGLAVVGIGALLYREVEEQKP